VEFNPYPSIRKIKSKESPRERILTDDEIRELWVAMEQESANMRDVLRLLLLLGQRSMETMSMSVVDIDRGRKEWTVPASQTKTGKPNVVPLPPMAWAIIKPRLKNDEWIFPSTNLNIKLRPNFFTPIFSNIFIFSQGTHYMIDRVC